MTNGGEWTPPPAPSGQSAARDAARERARELRNRHRKQDRRRRWLLRLVIGGGLLLAVAAVVGVFLFLRSAPPSGPLNMQSDGIRITQGGIAERGPGVPAEGPPIPFPANPAGVLDIRVYTDYLSAANGAFEEENGEAIRAWVDAGTATVEIHPVALLTTQSAGTQYSLRAAAAAGCVAQYAPDSFLDFHAALLAGQPAEGEPGPSNEELAARVLAVLPVSPASPAPTAPADPSASPQPTEESQPTDSPTPAVLPASAPGNIERCVLGERFRSWVLAATDRALEGPIPGIDLESIVAAPTITVNGRPFAYDPTGDAHEFRQFVLQIAGEEFVENATPTPAPTPEAAEEG